MAISLKRVSVFAEGLDHPECVTTHPDGSLWAGGEAGQIYRISARGKKVEEIANTRGFVLGVAISPDARWLAACDLKKQCVWRLDLKSGALRRFARGFRIPNHLVFARDGTLYVTDSGAFRQVNGRIFRFDADHSGRGKVWHRGPFSFANGIALGLDERDIFVNSTWLPGVERIEIRSDGSPGRRRVFVRLPRTLPDGLTFDQRGNLYVSCYTPSRIYKITPRRKVSVLIDDWESHLLAHPTNIVFGGKRCDQLFAANLGRWHITKIDLGVKGVPLAACARAQEDDS
jgi:sugar lactone lactonase YvrE